MVSFFLAGRIFFYFQGMAGNHWDQNAAQYQASHGFHPDVNLGESQTSATSVDSAKRSSLTSSSSFPQDNGAEPEDHVDSTGLHEPAPSIFDLQPTQQKIIAPKLRKRTISETSTGSGVGQDRHPSGGQGHQQQKQKTDSNKDSLVRIVSLYIYYKFFPFVLTTFLSLCM